MAVTEEVLPAEVSKEQEIEWEAWIRERDDPRISHHKPEALAHLVVVDVSSSWRSSAPKSSGSRLPAAT